METVYIYKACFYIYIKKLLKIYDLRMHIQWVLAMIQFKYLCKYKNSKYEYNINNKYK